MKRSDRNKLDKKGCGCGTAASTPGKLTCYGQRCPCYSNHNPCLDCRCKGCRNPNKVIKIEQASEDTDGDEINVEWPWSQCNEWMTLLSLCYNATMYIHVRFFVECETQFWALSFDAVLFFKFIFWFRCFSRYERHRMPVVLSISLCSQKLPLFFGKAIPRKNPLRSLCDIKQKVNFLTSFDGVSIGLQKECFTHRCFWLVSHLFWEGLFCWGYAWNLIVH